MSKTPRNGPCPCGSGKKYKKCCLQKDEAERIDSSKSVEKPGNTKQRTSADNVSYNYSIIEDDLDILSNSIIDLIKDEKFDEAEEKCNVLLNAYPDVVDGYERSAMLYEALGENEKAVAFYQKTVEFVNSNPGYDNGLIEFSLDKIEQLS